MNRCVFIINYIYILYMISNDKLYHHFLYYNMLQPSSGSPQEMSLICGDREVDDRQQLSDIADARSGAGGLQQLELTAVRDEGKRIRQELKQKVRQLLGDFSDFESVFFLNCWQGRCLAIFFWLFFEVCGYIRECFRMGFGFLVEECME